MVDIDIIIMLLFNSIAIFVGGLGNVVILINCVMQGIREGPTPFISIAFTMCLSNSLLTCCQFFGGLACIFKYLQTMAKLFLGISMAFLCYVLWSSTWLSLYYQFKIVTSFSTANVYVQRHFHVFLPCFMLFSLVLSVVVGVSAMSNEADSFPTSVSNISTQTSHEITNHVSLQVVLYCAFATLSILVTFTSLMTILTSLRRHVDNIKKNSNGISNASFKAHYTAARSITSLLVFNLLLFVSQIIGYLVENFTWVSTMKTITLSALITGCPYVLMSSNKKLKTEVKRTFESIFHVMGKQ